MNDKQEESVTSAQPLDPAAHSEVRRALGDHKMSAVAKYRQLNVGKESLWALWRYEWRTWLLGGMGGAMGFFVRQKLYRSMFGGFGKGVAIGRNVTIRHPHRIVIGDNVVIDDNCVLDGKGNADTTLVIDNDVIVGRNSILSCKGGTMHIGERTNISVNCTLISESQMSIGRRVLIAGHCYLIAGGNHGIDRIDIPILDQPMAQKGGVDIADDCWLGANVTILDGVKIGTQTVVAAGAVVNKSLAKCVIAAGTPATILRHRGDCLESE